MTGPADSSPSRPRYGSIPGSPSAAEGSSPMDFSAPPLPRPQPLPPAPGLGLPAGLGFGGPPPWETSGPVQRVAAAALGVPLIRRPEELQLPDTHTPGAVKRIYLGLNADFLGQNFAYDPDEVIAFMIERLSTLRQDPGYAPDEPTRDAIDRLIQSYRTTLLTITWGRRLAQIAETGTPQEYMEAKREIKDLMLSILRQQGQLSLASGYKTVGGGHRLALFLTLDEHGQVSATAVHKGAGLQTYHPDWEYAAGQGYVDPWIKLNPVSIERLEKSPFLDILMDLWVPRMGDKATEYRVEDLFEGLLPEWPAGLTQRADKVLAKPHRAGTCAIKPSIAELLEVLPSDQGRLLKLDLTCTAIERYLDKADPLDAAAAEVLDKILAKLMRRLAKQQAAGRIAALHPLVQRVLEVNRRGQAECQRVRDETQAAVQAHRMELEVPLDHATLEVFQGCGFYITEAASLEGVEQDKELLEEYRKEASFARRLEILSRMIQQTHRSSRPDTVLQAAGRACLADFLRQLPLDIEGIDLQRLLDLTQEARDQAARSAVPLDLNQEMFVDTKLMALSLRQAQQQGVPLRSRLLSPAVELLLKMAVGLRPTSPHEARQLRQIMQGFREILVEPSDSDPLNLPFPYRQTFSEEDVLADPLLQWVRSYVDEHDGELRQAIVRSCALPLAATVFRRQGGMDLKEPFMRPLAAMMLGEPLPPALMLLRRCMGNAIWRVGSPWSVDELHPRSWSLTVEEQGGNCWATLKIEEGPERRVTQAQLLRSFDVDADRQPWESRLIAAPPTSQNDLLSVKTWQQQEQVQQLASLQAIHAMQAPLVCPAVGVSLWMDFVESHFDRMQEPLFAEKLSSGLFSTLEGPEGPIILIEAIMGQQDHAWEALQDFLIRKIQKTESSQNRDTHHRLLRVLVQCCGFAAEAGKDLGPATQFLRMHLKGLLEKAKQLGQEEPQAASALLTHLIGLHHRLEWDAELQGVPRGAAELLANNGSLRLETRLPFLAVAVEATRAWDLFEAEGTLATGLPHSVRSHPFFPYKYIRQVKRIEGGYTFLNDFGHHVTLTFLTTSSFSLSREMEWIDGTRALFIFARESFGLLPLAGRALVEGSSWVHREGKQTRIVVEARDESGILSFYTEGRLLSAAPHHLQLAVESYRQPSALLKRFFALSPPQRTLVWRDSSGQIVRVEMPTLSLVFEASKRQGRTVWSSPSYPGYEVDPHDQHPWLEPFSGYLKLKAPDGRTLVLIPDQHVRPSQFELLTSIKRAPDAVPQLQSAPCPVTQPKDHPRVLSFRALPTGELQAHGPHFLYDTLFLCLLCLERQDHRAAYTLIRELERRQIRPDSDSLNLIAGYITGSRGSPPPESWALLAHLLCTLCMADPEAATRLFFFKLRIALNYFQSWTNLRDYALTEDQEKWLAEASLGQQDSSLLGDCATGGWLTGEFSQWPLRMTIETPVRDVAKLFKKQRYAGSEPPGAIRHPAEDPLPVPNRALPQQALAVNFLPYLRILDDYNRALKEEPSTPRDQKLQALSSQREEIAQLVRVACLTNHSADVSEIYEWTGLLAYLVAPEFPALHLPGPRDFFEEPEYESNPSRLVSAARRQDFIERALQHPDGPGQDAVQTKILEWLQERSFSGRFQLLNTRPSPLLPVPDIPTSFALEGLLFPTESLPPAGLPSELLKAGLVKIEDHGCQLTASFDALERAFTLPHPPKDPSIRAILQQNRDDLGAQRQNQPPLRTVTRDLPHLEAVLLLHQREFQARADRARDEIAQLMTVPETDTIELVRQQGHILPQLSLQDVLVAFATDKIDLVFAANPTLTAGNLQQLRSHVADYLDATAQSQQTLRGLQQLRTIEQKRESRLFRDLELTEQIETLRTTEPDGPELARLEAELHRPLQEDADLAALEHRLATTLTSPRCYDDTSDLLLPLFEVLTNIRVTPEQAKAYRELTQAGEESNFNLKAPTGFGKSSVLLGLWLLKTRRSQPLTMLALPAPLLTSTVEQLHQTLGRSFEASFLVPDITRDKLQKPGFLAYLLRTLQRAEAEQRILILPIGALHALANLQIKESLFKQDEDSAWILRRILALLETKTSLFIDESRECLSIHQRYDYAVGPRQHLSPELSREIQDLYRQVVLQPDVLERFDLEFIPYEAQGPSQRTPVTPENYAAELLPLLAAHATNAIIRRVGEHSSGRRELLNIRELLELDLQNRTSPDQRRTVRSTLRQLQIEESYLRLKRQLVVYLRSCLPLKTGERYTLSDRVPSRVAVPVTDGTENPRAEFATKEESANLTLQANLKLPLPSKTIEIYIKRLANELVQEGNRFKRTPRYQDFLAIARGAHVADDPTLLTEPDLLRVTEFLNRPQHLVHKASVIGEVVLPQVSFYPHKISSSGMQIALATQQIRGASGTPDFDTTHPRLKPLNQQTPVLSNLLALVEHSSQRLFQVEGSTPQELLRSTLQKDPEARLLIDVGNLLRHLSQQEAARIVLEANHAVQGVLVFDEEGKEQILTRHQQDPAGVSNDQLFHFLRRSKVVGTQLDRLSPAARALTTVACDTPQELFVQGIGRLRNLRHGNQGAQSTGIVWTPQDEKVMRQRLDREGAPAGERLSLQDLLRHLAFTQGQTRAKENVFALMVYMETLLFQQLQDSGFAAEDFEMLRDFLVIDTQQAEKTTAFEDTQQRPMDEVIELLIQRYQDQVSQAQKRLGEKQAQRLQTLFQEQLVPAFRRFVDLNRLPAQVAISDVSTEQCLVEADLTAQSTVAEQVQLIEQIAEASAVSTEHEATRLQHLHQDLLQFTPATPLESGTYWNLPPAADSGLLGVEMLEAPNTHVLSVDPLANGTLLKPIHHLLLVLDTRTRDTSPRDTRTQRWSFAPLGFEDAAAYAKQMNQGPPPVVGKEFFLVANLPSGFHLLSARGDPENLSLNDLDLKLIELLGRVQRGLALLPDQMAELRRFLNENPDQEHRFQEFYKRFRVGLIL
jgi:hypothetical protein